MDRTEKAEAVSSLNATLGSAASVVVVRNLGMTVAQSTVLRQQMQLQLDQPQGPDHGRIVRDTAQQRSIVARRRTAKHLVLLPHRIGILGRQVTAREMSVPEEGEFFLQRPLRRDHPGDGQLSGTTDRRYRPEADLQNSGRQTFKPSHR